MSDMNDPVNATKKLDERIRAGTKRCSEVFGPEVEKLERRLAAMPKFSWLLHREERNALKATLDTAKIKERTCVVKVTVQEEKTFIQHLEQHGKE
jgi:tRNA A58 N-methylase Trm61